jgi:CRP/FNR family transcriptional regulator, cyclic AMP receptor protein
LLDAAYPESRFANIQVLGIEELIALVDLSGPVLLDLLTPPTRAWMASLARRREYADGELVHARGDAMPTMEVVISGSMKLVRLRQDGSLSFVTMVGPGQHVADVLMLGSEPRTHNAVAVGTVTIDHYDHDAFQELVARPEVLLALYRIAGIRLNAAIAMIDDLRTLSREAHLAKLLLTFTSGSAADQAIGVVQEDLASILGISAMTLAKSLALFKSEGLIETGYRQVRVTDRKRLRQWLAAHEPD